MRNKNEERIAALEADGYEVHVQHDRLMLGGEALEKGGRTTVHAWKAPGGRTFCGVANCHPTKDRFNEHIGLTIALNRLEHEIRVEEAHVFPMIELKFTQDFDLTGSGRSFLEALFGKSEPEPKREVEEGDRVVIVEAPSRPDRVGRKGTVTLKRTLAGGGYDYSVLLDGDAGSTGQYPDYAVELDASVPAAEVTQRPDVVQRLYEMGAALGLTPERIDAALDEDVKADAARAKAEDRARQADQSLRVAYEQLVQAADAKDTESETRAVLALSGIDMDEAELIGREMGSALAGVIGEGERPSVAVPSMLTVALAVGYEAGRTRAERESESA